METMLSDPLLQVYCNLTTLQTLSVPQALLMRGLCRKCKPPIDYLPMTTLQALSVPQVLLMRGLCRKSCRLVDASCMWAILEAELNKANTFNVCSHGEYFDEDCKPFRFRTMLRQEKRELALEVRKLSSDECTKVVHIIKKERLFGQVLSRCSVSEIEDYLDSLSASTQSEIVLFMHGLHPGKGMLRDQQLKRKGHSRDNEECTCKHLDHGMFPNAKCPAMEIRERLDDSPSWYKEYEIAQGFVDDERRHNSLTSKDPRIHPTFAALSPFSRCRNLVTFSRKVVLALQANVAFKPPFPAWRTNVSFVLTHLRFKVHLTSCESQEDSFSTPTVSIFMLLTCISLPLQKHAHTHTRSGSLPIRARMTRRSTNGSLDFIAYMVIRPTVAPCATRQWWA
jgi:hypothetical protein